MYRCKCCNAHFDKPKTHKECIEDIYDMPSYVEFRFCPNCKSNNFEEVKKYENDI